MSSSVERRASTVSARRGHERCGELDSSAADPRSHVAQPCTEYCLSNRPDRARRAPAPQYSAAIASDSATPASRAAQSARHRRRRAARSGRPAQNAQTNGRPVMRVHSSPRSIFVSPAASWSRNSAGSPMSSAASQPSSIALQRRAASARTPGRCPTLAHRTRVSPADVRELVSSPIVRISRRLAREERHRRHRAVGDDAEPGTIRYSRPAQVLDRRDHPEIDRSPRAGAPRTSTARRSGASNRSFVQFQTVTSGRAFR